MWRDPYVTQKIFELERQRRELDALRLAGQRASARRRPLAPFARFTGRRVRAIGEAIEAWGTPERACVHG
jgi:hypothetical protein